MKQAFEDVYREHKALVRGFIYRLCGNGDLADELTDETFHRAWRRWDTFRGDSSAATYLCGIAKRVYGETLKRPAELPLEEDALICDTDAAQELIDSDRRMTALKTLHNLSEPYREVFMLRTFCDMKLKEIGELFGKSDTWARVTYHRARLMLREAMKEAEENDG